MNKKAKRVTLAKLLCLVMAVMTVGALLLGALTRASYRHDVADAAKSPDTKILYHSKVILSGDKEGTGTFQDSLFQADIIVRAEVAGPEEYQFQALLVPLRIKEVLKGDVKAGDLIDFYEISFSQRRQQARLLILTYRPLIRCSQAGNTLYLLKDYISSCLSGAAGAGRLPGSEPGSLLLPARDHRATHLG